MKEIVFDNLVEKEEILKAIERMGFTTPTPVQAQSISPMTQGKDITVQAPTGTGKTLAFSIPILTNIDMHSKDLQAIILSPTRELAVQIAGVIRDLSRFMPGLRVTTIYGGERIEKQFAQLRRCPQIVVATPGRLLDHMSRKTIILGNVTTLVLDEADRMLDMGFRPDLHKIIGAMPKQRQTALFSATLSKEIRQIAQSYQVNAEIIRIEQQTLTVESVTQYYTTVARGEKNQELVNLFRREHPVLTIVFTNTIRMSERIVKFLRKEGYKSAFLHGDMRQGQRNTVMERFRTGQIHVLVATDVASRGIDVDNIDMVVNYDLPFENENYVHRIGRTGRAEQEGVSHTFIFPDEVGDFNQLEKETKAVITYVPAESGEPPEEEQRPKTSGRKRGRSHQSRGGHRQQGGQRQGRRPTGQGSKPATGGSSQGRRPTGQGAKPATGGSSQGRRPTGQGAKPATGGSSQGRRPAGQGAKPATGGSSQGRRPTGQGSKPATGGSSQGRRPTGQGSKPATGGSSQGRRPTGQGGKPRRPSNPSGRKSRPSGSRQKNSSPGNTSSAN